MTRTAAVFALLAAGCTHFGDAPPLRHPEAPVAADAQVIRDAVATVDAEGQCPVPIAHASLVVAEVAGETLTACDVAIAARARTRRGLPPVGVRALVDEIVRETSLAALAREELDGGVRVREVEEVLADALLREEARAGVTVPDDGAVERWYRAHLDDFTRPPRVRARWIVLRTEAAARAAITALRGGRDFAELLAESIDPHRERDHGDLGELREDDVPADVGHDVVAAAFGLAADGDVAEAPVRVSIATTVTVRRRPRVRSVPGWAVVQRIERHEAEVLPLEAVRRRVVHRMLRERYENAREAARAQWIERLRDAVRGAIDARGMASVRGTAAGR